MEIKKEIYNFLCLIIFILIFEEIKSDKSYEIHIYFQSNGLQSLYCDDNIKFFGTQNINFYKIKEDGVKTNINSLLRQDSSSHFCKSLIKYNVNSVNEKIIIELKNNPNTLKKLFSGSSIYKIERFDYPFPIDGSDYNEMFYHCTELTYVDFSNFSFENTTDVSGMFNYCKKLITIIFPKNSKSSYVENFMEMFAHAESLTSIDLTYFSFVKAKNMAYMFNGCKNLAYINFPKNEKAENLQLLNDMFGVCPNLISLDLSSFSFKNVETMAYMFNGCNRLSTLILPKENNIGNNLKDIKYMFYECKELTSIDLSGISLVNIKDLSSMFYGCSSLENLILPSNEKANNVVDFSYMFFDCGKLKSVDLSFVSLINAQKLSFMFFNCSSLLDIKFPIEEKSTKIEDFQYMFFSCQSLISIDLSNFSFGNAKNLNSMFFFCSNLENLILPKNEIATNVEDISFMFSACNKLRIIDLSGISLRNIYDMSYIFSYCTNLENIIFANDEPINKIEEISYAFSNCYNLKSIDLSKFNLNLVTSFEYLFYSCSSLETIVLPEQKINNVESFFHTFDNCTKLKSIDLKKISFLNAKDIGFMFANCLELLEIIFDHNEKVENINNMNGTFANCTSITSIDIGHIYINNDAILDSLFFNCHSLKEINISNIDTTKSSSTNNFLNNENLEKCLYYNLDNIHSDISSVFKACSQSIFFHKCDPCINTYNLDEYCTINVNNTNLNFYYFKSELNLPISERKCLWTNNYDNYGKYVFINNSIINSKSFFDIYCDYYCEICSDNEYGCTKCKNNLYPIDTEYNKFINNEISFFYCYEKKNMKKFFFFDEENQQYIKCAEKCGECLKGVDICNECNEDKKYYPIENIKNECWKVSPDNYCFDREVNQWRKCNERCSKCKKQVKSELDHQCEKCADNYYPYAIDRENYENFNLTGHNCWLISEVKSKHKNYFLNSNNQFEQCDISCSECETKKDNCLECQMNYYYINGHKNGTCFSYPLRQYALVNINGESVFSSCFHLCENCNQISRSFLYQQCSKCDEIDYTLDEYSYNKSYCIPKDKSDSYLIKYQTKWYIKNFIGIENLIIENRNLKLDYQRLLNDEIFYNQNLEYEIVDECPIDKPYVIYSTRQCVSSCYSNNLIEFGIFMTKKLYLYNNICYDKCPYGSIEDDETSSCIEINKYLVNQTITIDYFINIISYENRLEYLGDGYAKDTTQIFNSSEFRNYLSNETYDPNYDEEEIIQKKKEMKMPIYNFSECISKIIKYYNLNESENIFSEIIEYNNGIDKKGQKNSDSILNSTSFRFFLNNGSIINHSICYNLDIIVMKFVNNINFEYSLYEEIKNQTGIDIFDDSFDIKNNCAPIMGDNDLLKQFPCDKGCSFVSFDRKTNYSTCKCKILNEEENGIISESINQFENSEMMETFSELLEKSNLKHISCYKSIKASHLFSINGIWIPLFSFIILIVEIVLFDIFLCITYRKIINLYFKKKREAKSRKNISENSYLINNDNDDEETKLISEDYGHSRNIYTTKYHENPKKYFFKTFWIYFKNNVIKFNIIDNNEFNPPIFKLIKIFIFIFNYLFITALLFTGNYITLEIKIVKNEFESVLTKEILRIIIVFIIAQFLNMLISLFFNDKENLEENDKNLKNGMEIEEYSRQIDYLKCCFKIKFIIAFIFILILHLTIIYFFIIFTCIYSFKNYQLYLFIYFMLTIAIYFIVYFILYILVALIRLISLKCENSDIFKISAYLAECL